MVSSRRSLARSASSLRIASVAVVVGAVIVALTAPAAHAQQGTFIFSGGNGSPLTINLVNSVTYTITAAQTPSSSGPYFDFQGAAPISTFITGSTGNITYTINGGAPKSLSLIRNDFNRNSVKAGDLDLVSSSSASLAVGDVIVLNAGTVMTTSNISGTAPANGTFSSFIFDGQSKSLSNPPASAAAPEPGSIALLALAGLPAVGVIARRRRNAKA